MASFYSSWVGGDDWRIRLDVTEDADETGCTYSCALHWDNTYASPSNLSSSWSITVAGDTKSGTVTLSGSSDRRIASFTKRVAKGTAKKTVSFAATFKITGSSVAAYRTGAKLSGSRPLAAKESYTVRYDANGGTGAPAAQTKWHGTALRLSTSKPTRAGHSFQGWAKTASGPVAYAPGASYAADAPVTLYAVWKANTYRVSYDANGGTGAPAAQTKTYGKALTLSKTAPRRDNHDFLGWGTSAESTTASYEPGGSYTRNAAATLYAVWRLAHTPPEITGLRVDRCAPDGTVSDEGESALVEFGWSVEEAVASVAIEHRRSGTTEWERTGVQASGQSGSVRQVVGAGALSGDHAWEVRVTVADANLSTSATRTIASMFYAIDVRAGGRGVAFGKPADADGFEVAMDARFSGALSAAEGVTVPDNVPYVRPGHVALSTASCPYTAPFVEYGAGNTSGGRFKAHRAGRFVQLVGFASSTRAVNPGTDTVEMGRVPEGYRPLERTYAVCQGSSMNRWMAYLDPDGTLYISRYGAAEYAALKAQTAGAAGSWLPFSIAYVCEP